jgi:hypothetical protein
MIREIMLRQRSRRIMKMERKQFFIIAWLQNLKRIGEGALRWSFFTLNLFMFTLYTC